MSEIDLGTLTGKQLDGYACALCGRRLYADRSLGVHRGTVLGQETSKELWACAPDCRTAAARRQREVVEFEGSRAAEPPEAAREGVGR